MSCEQRPECRSPPQACCSTPRRARALPLVHIRCKKKRKETDARGIYRLIDRRQPRILGGSTLKPPYDTKSRNVSARARRVEDAERPHKEETRVPFHIFPKRHTSAQSERQNTLFIALPAIFHPRFSAPSHYNVLTCISPPRRSREWKGSRACLSLMEKCLPVPSYLP